MKIMSVVGARPNFMKIAPFIRAIEDYNNAFREDSQPVPPSRPPSGSLHHSATSPLQHILVHTGQHYDDKMSLAFFEALDIPQADINLEIGSGSHAEQVGQTMIAFEKVLREHRPDWVVVVGDVNATCACSITAKKEHVKLAHIEAGLRSRDMTMPEEVNRLVTDRLSDLLLTPDQLSSANLRAEGAAATAIHFVGNIMIDTLEHQRAKAERLEIATIVQENAIAGQKRPEASPLRQDAFALMTMHRPSNVDDAGTLTAILDFLLEEVAAEMPLVWPIHPRTQQRLQDCGLWEKVLDCPGVLLLHPLGYHELLRLNMAARVVLTDSGGLQEECCVLGTPCLTLRWNTERPVTLQEHGGASILVGNDVHKIRDAYREMLVAERAPARPELWDGRTAQRIVQALVAFEG
ncbi:non-hydrolyzing UDP-N-acetylglucosamine 2-epimerase [Desulfohalobium retbaense]|uniref:UDP-N-acetylglucosamine 2-epimerase n=1 Tax=Desulfohalobium retbaense (strain ATCC 49708 / DSM 5692 / JCM 16813 / HR100) TaxID=485915 RepID=C8X069_DESRD|nr:UDP-N-acetylglucosamine 2-epimerase (non-hydrolyzing) [Desulfohalobium retbaense]ACV67694.1 UDP-N-acetylglucosamine 2-epimerase [Desulfohalobium retbaense DSM 5692]